MKSVFKNVFTCSALLLATFTANASADHGVLADAIALDALTNVYSSIPLDKVASSDDDQADSADAETMLA